METLTLTRENYYDVGNEKELVISNSALSYINPNQGGSFLRFKRFLSGQMEKKDSLHLEKGKLIHKYIENPDEFVVANEDKPSEAICQIVDRIFHENSLLGRDFQFLSEFPNEILKYAREVDYGSNWKEPTIIDKVIKSGEHYYQHLIDSAGKKMLTAEQKLCLSNIKITLENSTVKDDLFNKKISEASSPYSAELLGEKYFLAKEYPILFTLAGFRCKALLDYLYINFETKEVIIRDLKTTSQPVNKFMGTIEFNVDYEKSLGMRIKNGSFQNYHYYRQMAFYLNAVKSLLPDNGFGYKFAFVIDAIETIDPYEMQSFNVPQQWIMAGQQEIKLLFDLVKEYAKNENISLL